MSNTTAPDTLTSAALSVPFAVLPAPRDDGHGRTRLKPPLIARDTLAAQAILGWEDEDFRLYRAVRPEAILRLHGGGGWVVPADIDAVFCVAGSGEYLIDWLARHGVVEDTSRGVADDVIAQAGILENELVKEQVKPESLSKFPPSVLVAIEQFNEDVGGQVQGMGTGRDDLLDTTDTMMSSLRHLGDRLDEAAGGDPLRCVALLHLYQEELRPYLSMIAAAGLAKQGGFGALYKAVNRKPAPPRK